MRIVDETETKGVLQELRELHCTQSLSQGALISLACFGEIVDLQADAPIWEMGDDGNHFVIIATGLAEIIRHTKREEELSMGLFGPCDLIGLSAAMHGTPYPGTARTLADNTRVVRVRMRSLLESKSAHLGELQVWMREMLLLHEQVLRDKIDILNAGSVESRVFELIAHLVRRFGKRDFKHRTFVPIRLTRAHVGRMTDTRVETVIRLVRRWQDEGLLEWKEDGIHVADMALLESKIVRNRRAT